MDSSSILRAGTVSTRINSGMDTLQTTGWWIVMNYWGTGSLLLLSPFPGDAEEVISCQKSLKREKDTGYLARLGWVAALVTTSLAHFHPVEELTKPADLILLGKCQSYGMRLSGSCCTLIRKWNSSLPPLPNMKSNAAHPVSKAGHIPVR